MVALRHRLHAGAGGDHDARALVAEDGGEEALGVGAGEGELVGVADAGRLDLDQHLALARALEVDLDDLQRLACGKGYGCAAFHRLSLPNCRPAGPGRSPAPEGAMFLGKVSVARRRRLAIE